MLGPLGCLLLADPPVLDTSSAAGGGIFDGGDGGCDDLCSSSAATTCLANYWDGYGGYRDCSEACNAVFDVDCILSCGSDCNCMCDNCSVSLAECL